MPIRELMKYEYSIFLNAREERVLLTLTQAQWRTFQKVTLEELHTLLNKS